MTWNLSKIMSASTPGDLIALLVSFATPGFLFAALWLESLDPDANRGPADTLIHLAMFTLILGVVGRGLTKWCSSRFDCKAVSPSFAVVILVHLLVCMLFYLRTSVYRNYAEYCGVLNAAMLFVVLWEMRKRYIRAQAAAPPLPAVAYSVAEVEITHRDLIHDMMHPAAGGVRFIPPTQQQPSRRNRDPPPPYPGPPKPTVD